MSENPENKIRGSTDEQKMRQTFARNLTAIMKQRNIKTSELAHELHISRQSVHKWVHGLSLPRSGMLQKISEVLFCDMTDLIMENIFDLEGNSEDESLPAQLEKIAVGKNSIPVYDSVSCGIGAFVDEDAIDFLKLPEGWINSSNDYFANRAEGDSMEPFILNGDYLIFQKTDDVPAGNIGAFSLNGEYFCKRLKQYNDGSLWLISDNPEYPPIPVKPEDDFRSLGKLSFKILKETVQ